MQQNEFSTVSQLSKKYGINRRNIQRWASEDCFENIIVGKAYFINEESFVEYIKEKKPRYIQKD